MIIKSSLSDDFVSKFYGVNHFLCIWLERLGVATGIVALLVSFVDVVMYKLFHMPIQGSLDLVRFGLLIAIASIGSIVLLEDRHLSIEFLISKLPKRIQTALDIVTSFFGLVVSAGVSWYSVLYGKELYMASERSGTTNIPLFPFAYVIAFSYGLMGLIFILRIAQFSLKLDHEEK